MGCFNTVRFRCPECSAFIEVQTKAGDCSLRVFSSVSVPIADAGGLLGDELTCSICKESFRIGSNSSNLQLFLERVEPETLDEDWH